MFATTLPLRLTLTAAALLTVFSAHAQQAAAATDAAVSSPVTDKPVSSPVTDKPATEAKAKAAPGAKPAWTGKRGDPAQSQVQQVEVRGSADSYNPRRDDTASKIIVTHDEIVKYGDTSIVDVLKRLPGVTIGGGGGGGRGGDVRMRGLGAGYTQVLLNGERAPAGFSIDSLAPDVIERIEVLRAASAEYSTQSVAGTINIVLKKAIKLGQREVKAGLGFGKGALAPGATLQMSDRVGAMSYSLSGNVFYQKFDRDSSTVEQGYDLNGNQVRLREGAVNERGHTTGLNLAPRINWTLDNGDTLTSQSFANLIRANRAGLTVVETPLGDAPLYPVLGTRGANEFLYARTDLNWVHKLDKGAKIDLKLGLGLGNGNNSMRRMGPSTPDRAALDSGTEADSKGHGFSTTGKYSTPLIPGHALSMGWDGGLNVQRDNQQERFGATYLPNETFDARIARMAGYTQDEWNLTPRLSVYLGVRWEGIQTTTSGSTFAEFSSRSSVWSPLLQTLWKLPDTKGDQVRFAITRTYKAPTTQNLIPRRFKSENNSETEPDVQGNPLLKPELALGFDLSYEHYFGEGGLLSASVSTRKIDGYTQSAVQFIDGRWVSMPLNMGGAQTRGLELEAKFPLRSFMETTIPLDLRVSLSRNWSTVDAVRGPNNRMAQQTPLSATFGADYKIGPLTTGGSYAFRTGGPVRISENQSASSSPRRDVDLYVLWKFDAKNQLRVSLSNVLGQDNSAESDYADTASQIALLRRTTTTPNPIQARVSMEMKF
jgi:outer membrane receptor for ferrienterochelin and colicins